MIHIRGLQGSTFVVAHSTYRQQENFNIITVSLIPKTIMHSSRMRTAHSLPWGGGVSVRGGLPRQRPPDRDSPGQRLPWTETTPSHVSCGAC